ncbi:MAG: hypothetical protein LQ338_003099 [Usnochroma carphineum]|nr:MAG: hypothetical protein LQ338_003099 [Usnochroma carphineum]
MVALVWASPTPANGLEASLPSRTEKSTATGSEAPTAQLANLTLTTVGDGDFTFTVSGGTVPLSDKGCFLLTFAALGYFVFYPLDWHSPRSAVQRDNRVPGISILFRGWHAEGGFDYSLMIWGLIEAFKYMVGQDQFRTWLFRLKWRGTLVGTIWFTIGNSQEGLEANRNDNWMDTTPTEFVDASSVTDNADVFEYAIREMPGNSLNIHDVMMVLIGGMRNMAGLESSDQVVGDHYESTFAPYRGKFELSPAVPPHTSPTWFTYNVVRGALGWLARWYYEHQVYRPTQIMIQRNGLYCGHGSLTDATATVAFGDGRDNVSTS